jgi:hypothetical protein
VFGKVVQGMGVVQRIGAIPYCMRVKSGQQGLICQPVPTKVSARAGHECATGSNPKLRHHEVQIKPVGALCLGDLKRCAGQDAASPTGKPLTPVTIVDCGVL